LACHSPQRMCWAHGSAWRDGRTRSTSRGTSPSLVFRRH
jgi:hypothetical protein